MSLSRNEKLVMAIVPKFVAASSVFGSTMIISQVTRNKRNLGQLQQQIVLGMSIVDVMASTVWVFTFLFVPPWDEDVLFALGNQRTCDAQGFVVQFSIAGVLYNAILALYYLLVIKFSYTEWKLNRLMFKRYVHVLPPLFGICTAVPGLFLGLYNPANWDCWIAAHPPGCQETYNAKGTEPNCVRGDNASLYQFAFFLAPLWTAIAFVVASMTAVCISVRQQERKAMKWEITGSRQGRGSKYSTVFRQSILYVGAFFVTWLFPTLTRLTQLIAGTAPSWLVVLSGCIIPIQGVLNCLVYFRPRYLRCKRESGSSGLVVVWNIVKMALGCCDCHGLACSQYAGDDGVENTCSGREGTARALWLSNRKMSIKYHNDEKDIETLADSTATNSNENNSQKADFVHADHSGEQRGSGVGLAGSSVSLEVSMKSVTGGLKGDKDYPGNREVDEFVENDR